LFYTVSAGVQYAFNANFSASLAYAYDFGRNGQDGLTAAAVQPREFDHQLVTLGAIFKF
jgi:opacity protein-like surface antigen